MQLTPAQRTAIDTVDRNLLIVACAGSGKTEVISQRIAGLLAQSGVVPKNIVAFTFTEKAAAELKERIHARVTEQHGSVIGLAEMYIGTMHGYALDLLHSHVPEAFKINVLSDVQARLLIDKNSRKSGLTTTCAVVQGKAPQPLKRYAQSRLYQQVMSILREDNVDLAGLRPDVADGFKSYMALLDQRRYYDFTQILTAAVDCLEANETADASAVNVRSHIKENIRYVVVDEYQDTNPIQERLIAGLTQFGANLCVVGDDDQTIYQWRGSAVKNILTLEDRYKDVERVTLNENFRSSDAIVDLGRSVVDAIAIGRRLPKQMVAAGHQVFERGDLLALTLPDLDAEAASIADRIEAIQGLPFTDAPGQSPRGMSWSDCAVLYRSVKRDAGPLVAELRRRGIPYIIKGLTGLFDTPEVAAAVACFKYAAGEINASDVTGAWIAADLGLAAGDLVRGIAVLDRSMRWDDTKAWDSVTLQATFLEFLEAVGLREERVPSPQGANRGELIFYNLGRFSTAIGDYERIHLTSPPKDRFAQFAKWIAFQAPDYYQESDGDNSYAQPDAVVLATVHQAKGMQWPAVFIPALRNLAFPNRRSGGLNVLHVVDAGLIEDAERYRGTAEDERRLFYVAVTRAQKFLTLTYAPTGKQGGNKPSEFFQSATRQQTVLTKPASLPTEGRLTPTPKRATPDVVLSFSDLKYLFGCNYSFKLRLMYGFDSPLQKELGYGKSLHDAMAEIHKRAIEGDIVDPSEAEALVDRHLNLPFANPAARDQLRPAAIASVQRYLDENSALLPLTEFSEQVVEIHPAPGVTVTGRIDLTRRLDTEEVSIVDFKSTERAQANDVSLDQLYMYALGYKELTGTDADLVEIHNLDKAGGSKREVVDTDVLAKLTERVTAAGDSLRTNSLPRLAVWGKTCQACDFVGICRDRQV
ncbi:MAG TPA: ATP-dependent DNA helicase [Actinocrinis sp.]|nr:ATP-dependent DNA helicase [Actinocrinis sp.]